MKMLFLVCLVLAAAAVSGNVICNGNCPELKAVENFNITAYSGVWYAVSKYPYDGEKGKCDSSEYTIEGQVIKTKNSHVVNGVQNSIEGTAKFAPNANNTGRLVISLKLGDKPREMPLAILDTDYVNYAITYNCKCDEKNKNHQDFAWIQSRSKKLEGDAKTAVDNFIKATTELDATKFLQTDMSEDACKFTNTRIITEPPATVA